MDTEVTPAVYPRLIKGLHFDIQSTGQKAPVKFESDIETSEDIHMRFDRSAS